MDTARHRLKQEKQWERIKWLCALIEHMSNRGEWITAHSVKRRLRRKDISMKDVVGVLDNLTAQGQLVSAHEPRRLAITDLDAGFTMAAEGRRSAIRAGNPR